MYRDRIPLYKDLEVRLGSKLLAYITSDRRGFETQIAADVIDIFMNQLDKIGIVPKISLYLYTRGGETAAAWNIINLLKLYCDELQVIVPHKAHSAGTLICIGANSIIMTKQATLGPIDPSINTFLNPHIPGAPPQNTFPVSVEAVKGYLAFAKEGLSIKDDV
ncbi:MAG: ATP-dependent Clp protease proteolytic subunit, partial [Synergistaceae bacterium]|nr:ATP-dependent Clp protease proteolytic subunit [Synergistaceae bacterium]